MGAVSFGTAENDGCRAEGLGDAVLTGKIVQTKDDLLNDGGEEELGNTFEGHGTAVAAAALFNSAYVSLNAANVFFPAGDVHGDGLHEGSYLLKLVVAVEASDFDTAHLECGNDVFESIGCFNFSPPSLGLNGSEFDHFAFCVKKRVAVYKEEIHVDFIGGMMLSDIGG